MRTSFFIAAVLSLAFGSIGWASVQAVTTTTDLAWLVRQIGGEKVSVTALLKGTENPHYVDALPSYIHAVANAQMVCSIGLELEIGWLPKVLARSGNAKVQPGGSGFCDTGAAVSVLEKPTSATNRAMGDVHPAGNPHFTLSPLAMADAANAVAATLARVDPQNATFYQRQLATAQSNLRAEHARQVAALRARPKLPLVMEYHREFAYFFSAYGLTSFGSLEEKPGVAPSAGRIAAVAQQAKAAGVKLLLAADYAPRAILEKFTELSGIPTKVVAMFPRQNSSADYWETQRQILGSVE